MSFHFEKESILPGSDTRSPYHINVPNRDSKPIDDLIAYFKFWKHFIKSLIFYLKEISVSKEFSANINYQLISSVQFPGFKDLPLKYQSLLESHNSQPGTPNKELKKTLSGTSLANSGNSVGVGSNAQSNHGGNSSSGENADNASITSNDKRPGLFKTKSNNSTFMKRSGTPTSTGNQNFNSHKRNTSSSTFFKNIPNHINSSLSLPLPMSIGGHQSGLILALPGSHNTNDVRIPPEFFPNDSVITNLSPLLINHHLHTFQAQMKTYKELKTKLIPRLESLLKNLSLKIKEIRSSLKNESFANDEVAKEISQTGKILTTYTSSIERYSGPKPVFKKAIDEIEGEEDKAVLDDPFLLKLKVDHQLKNQLIQENFLFASYLNLQNISKDLLTYVLKELNFITERFGKLINQESCESDEIAMVSLFDALKNKLQRSSNAYWEYFISHNKNFLNIYVDTPVSKKREIRNLSKLTLPYATSIHNKCIRSGIIYKKLKILKNYSGHFYVLTCNYLHEFKIENDHQHNNDEKQTSTPPLTNQKKKEKKGGLIDYNDVPLKSYNLNDYILHSKDAKNFKFVLQRVSNTSKKFTFKCKSVNDYNNWYGDLQELLQFGNEHLRRFKLVQDKMTAKEEETKRIHEQKLREKQANAAAHAANEKHETQGASDQPTTHEQQATAAALAAAGVHEQNIRDKIGNVNSNKPGPLNLHSISLANFPASSLMSSPINSGSGSQSPVIRSPLSNEVLVERNPFERTFSNHSASNLSSPNYSPNQILIGNATLSPPILASSNSSPHLVGHQQQHESYLQVQQEYLRQQQEILNLKIKQAELEQQSHNTQRSLSPQQEYFVLSPSNLASVSRVSSNDSLISMAQQSQLQQMLDTNKDILNRSQNFHFPQSSSSSDLKQNGLQQESNNDLSSGQNSSSEIPKVFVSSNH
ncbi:uncharacterized protein AC631_02771 [Debaryomyces fabryi]|uniref:PH domain-containing protein n=1 Tax=Debaryomyces fabryi TaxID=58627 RepID=A0A0V1PZK1_9ASCO|nr:uncharacterized protein AC631_02771 [Debaryomyces fabryi]KSA01477.1 hypothetical protein AC631_02771 [Debaryomyces fabryi]CUM57439.1 unnamed protein product [Debaryomyces fabryi]